MRKALSALLLVSRRRSGPHQRAACNRDRDGAALQLAVRERDDGADEHRRFLHHLRARAVESDAVAAVDRAAAAKEQRAARDRNRARAILIASDLEHAALHSRRAGVRVPAAERLRARTDFGDGKRCSAAGITDDATKGRSGIGIAEGERRGGGAEIILHDRGGAETREAIDGFTLSIGVENARRRVREDDVSFACAIRQHFIRAEHHALGVEQKAATPIVTEIRQRETTALRQGEILGAGNRARQHRAGEIIPDRGIVQ